MTRRRRWRANQINIRINFRAFTKRPQNLQRPPLQTRTRCHTPVFQADSVFTGQAEFSRLPYQWMSTIRALSLTFYDDAAASKSHHRPFLPPPPPSLSLSLSLFLASHHGNKFPCHHCNIKRNNRAIHLPVARPCCTGAGIITTIFKSG